MKNYEKIVKKMIEDFAEKALIQCFNNPDRKLIDHLNYMGIVVVRANEQSNPKFILDEAMKDKIISIVDKQWKLFKETKTGSELLNFYENKNQMQEVVKNPEGLDKFLSTVTSKKMIDELFVAFVKAGDLDSVKKLVEKKSPKIKPDVDMCVIAVEHNQPAILDYLFHKDKYQVSSEQSYMGIYARKSMEYNAPAVFEHVIKIIDIDQERLLPHAVFYKFKDYAYKLVDLGTKLEEIDSRVDKVFLEDITSYYNKKLVNDNLEHDLSDKPKKKSAKI
jgi:hypothetical protein